MTTNTTVSFPCTWSKTTKIITIGMLLLFTLSLLFLWTINFPEQMAFMKYLLSILIVGLPLAFLGFMMPLRLSVNKESLSVKLLFGSLRIATNEIVEIKRVSKSYLNNSIRVFGSGGFCGYLGKFKHTTSGNYTIYATDPNEMMLIRTVKNNKDNIYVFSCANADEFIKCVEDCRK